MRAQFYCPERDTQLTALREESVSNLYIRVSILSSHQPNPWLAVARPAERVLPRNRLLSVLLLTLYFLTASDIFPDPEDVRNAIALSIEAIMAELSRVKARSCCFAKACTSQGCARVREAFYEHRHIGEKKNFVARGRGQRAEIGSLSTSL